MRGTLRRARNTSSVIGSETGRRLVFAGLLAHALAISRIMACAGIGSHPRICLPGSMLRFLRFLLLLLTGFLPGVD